MSEQDRDIEMHDEYDFTDAIQGPVVPPAPGKTRITIRLDNDILDWFRAQVHRQGGGNYQTLVNQALRQYIQSQEGQPGEGTGKAIFLSYSSEGLEQMAKILTDLRNVIVHDASGFEERLRRVIREELQRAS